LLAVLPAAFILLSFVVVALNDLFGRAVRPVTCLAFVAGVVVWVSVRRRRERRAAREMADWVAAGGWEFLAGPGHCRRGAALEARASTPG
jgi:hypothetical protein